jgi:hypothetical protein
MATKAASGFTNPDNASPCEKESQIYPGLSYTLSSQTVPGGRREGGEGFLVWLPPAIEACRFTLAGFSEPAHFRCPSIRETSSEVGARFGTRRGGLFADELIMGGVPLVGSLRRTRLPFPSRVFEILVCAMAAALKQNTKPAVSTVFVIALIPKFPESFGGVLKTRKLLSTKFG